MPGPVGGGGGGGEVSPSRVSGLVGSGDSLLSSPKLHGRRPRHPCGQTHKVKNITFPHLRVWAVIMNMLSGFPQI